MAVEMANGRGNGHDRENLKKTIGCPNLGHAAVLTNLVHFRWFCCGKIGQKKFPTQICAILYLCIRDFCDTRCVFHKQTTCILQIYTIL